MALLELLQTHQILSTFSILLLLSYGYHILLVNPLPSEPPLIKGYVPFLGAAPQAMSGPLKFLTSCRARHGDIFTIYALGLRITFVTDPISGVPAVFKKAKQLSFKSGLNRLFVKVLGFSEERVNQEEMNKEHFAMIPTYLLSTTAVDELTGRFVVSLLKNI